MNLVELDGMHLWHPFTQMAQWKPLVIIRGEGSFLFDEHGHRYLDGVSSLWSNVHGHNHPKLNRALREQIERIAHSTFLGLTHEPGIRLAERLVNAAPAGLNRVFYSDSGSTAVEIALKQSFQYWQLRGRTSKQRFLRLTNAYHGDTLGAVGVGGMDLFHRIFGPLLVQSIPIPSPTATDATHSLERIGQELDRRAYEIAAFILEPLIQGAAGMLVQPPGYLSKVAELCDHHDVHLIVDEVATGFGRTSKLFACEHEGVQPDFMCLAKGITGGYLPLAATLSTEEIYEAFLGSADEQKQFFHGHTYTGNPLACAVALESLQLLHDHTLANAKARTKDLSSALHRIKEHSGVKEIRQRGMMAGIELESRGTRMVGAEVSECIRSHGVILRPLGNVIVWMPPLTVSVDEIDLLEQATAVAIDQVMR